MINVSFAKMKSNTATKLMAHSHGLMMANFRGWKMAILEYGEYQFYFPRYLAVRFCASNFPVEYSLEIGLNDDGL